LFISLADLGRYIDEKSKQEIHTLEEFATFHWEFRRLATRLAKEKIVSVLMVLTRHTRRAFNLSFGTKFCFTSQMKRHLALKERLLQLNMSGKGPSIYWKVLTTNTSIPTLNFI